MNERELKKRIAELEQENIRLQDRVQRLWSEADIKEAMEWDFRRKK